MNSRSHNHYLLAAVTAALLLGGCTMRERRVETLSRTFPAAGITRLEVQEVNGRISVDAGGSNEIVLVATVRSRGMEPNPQKENNGWFDTRVDGDTLIIGRKRRGKVRLRFFQKNDVQVDYELKVPPTVELDLTTINGRIATRGIGGETEANTINGTIDIEATGANEVSAKAVNGRVRARFLENFQGAHLKTVNGSVVAVLPPTASFACDLSQVNGDLETSFPLSIHSHPGSRRVSGEVNGGRHELRIVTVNGDIRLENSPVPPVPPVAPAAPTAPVAPVPPTAPISPTT